jgi:acyl-CoA thioester hydrolase
LGLEQTLGERGEMLKGAASLALKVRPADLDSVGHVNNAAALEYLEAGRWGWMADRGLQRNPRVFAVVSRIEIDYLREIPFGNILVRTEVDELPADLDDELTYRVSFRQEILLTDAAKGEADHTVAARARVFVAFVDTEDRSLRTLHDFLLKATV